MAAPSCCGVRCDPGPRRTRRRAPRGKPRVSSTWITESLLTPDLNTGVNVMLSKLMLAAAVGLVGLGVGAQSAGSQPAKVEPGVAGAFYAAEAAAVEETADRQARQVLLRLPDQSLVTLNAAPEL